MRASVGFATILSVLTLLLSIGTDASARNIDPAFPEFWDHYLQEEGKTLHLHRDITTLQQPQLLRWVETCRGFGIWEIFDTSTSDRTGFRSHHAIEVMPATEYEISMILKLDHMDVPPPEFLIEHRDYNLDDFRTDVVPLLSPSDQGLLKRVRLTLVTSSETHWLMLQMRTSVPGIAEFEIRDLWIRQASPTGIHAGDRSDLIALEPPATGTAGEHGAEIGSFGEHRFFFEGTVTGDGNFAPSSLIVDWRDGNGASLREDAMVLRPTRSVTGQFSGVEIEYIQPSPAAGPPLSAYYSHHPAGAEGSVTDDFRLDLTVPEGAAEVVVGIPGGLDGSPLRLDSLTLVAQQRVPPAALELSFEYLGGVLLVPDMYDTIGGAMEAAVSGESVIHITQSGSYEGFVHDKAVPVVANVDDVVITSEVVVSAPGDSRLENLTFEPSEAHGITVANGEVRLTIAGSTIRGAGTNGIRLTAPATVVIEDSLVTDNEWGLRTLTTSGATITIERTTFSGNGHAIHLQRSANLTLHASTIDQNRNDGLRIGAFTSGESVVTAVGTTFDGNRNGVTFLDKGVLTATDCRFHSNSLHGIQVSGDQAAGSRIRLTSCTVDGNGGPGLHLSRPAETHLTDVEITGNGSFGLDHAVAAGDPGASTIHLENTLLAENGDGAIRAVSAEAAAPFTVTITGSEIGGATNPVVSLGGDPDHQGGGSMGVSINGTSIRSLSNGGGDAEVLSLANARGTVRNTIVEGGRTGVALGQPTSGPGGVSLQHCTIVASNGIAGVDVRSGAGHGIVNTIVAGFQTGLLGAEGVDLAENRHNLLDTPTPYAGGVADPGSEANNITGAAPRFLGDYTGPGTGNLRLSTESHAIDAGDPALGVDTDIAGTTRPSQPGGAPDIGAYEYDPAILLVPDVYGTIGAAMAAAVPGRDRIHITEPGTHDGFTVNKAVPVIAKARDVVITSQITVSASGPSRLENLTVEPETPHGIDVANANVDLTISRCRIQGAGINAVRVTRPARVHVEDTTFAENGWGIRTVTEGGAVISVDRCTFRDNRYALHLQRSATVTITDSLLDDNSDDGIRVGAFTDGTSEIIVANSTIRGNDRGITFWDAGKLSATGLVISSNRSEGIWVRNSEDAAETVLELEGGAISGNAGGGILIARVADSELRNVLVSGNGGYGFERAGAAGDNEAGLSTHVFAGVHFTGNAVGAIKAWAAHEGLLVDLLVTDTRAEASGATGSLVSLGSFPGGNHPPGIVTATIDRSRFHQDSKQPTCSEAISAANAHVVVRNSVIEGGQTGVLLDKPAAPPEGSQLLHCTVVGRPEVSGGIGVDVIGGDGHEIVNSIIAGHQTALTASVGSGFQSIRHNLLSTPVAFGSGVADPGGAANNLFDPDPRFLQPHGDYRLGEDSPAIDAGDPGLGLTEDIRGLPRPAPGSLGPDIGAHEFRRTTPTSLWLAH